MRILQVLPYFSPQFGGSVQVVYQTSKQLASRGHQVTVLAGDFGIKQGVFPSSTFDTIFLPSTISRWGFHITPQIISWCHQHIHEFNIIHLHEFRTFQNIIVHLFALQNNIPYIISAHGTLPYIIQRKFAKHIYDIFFGKHILRFSRKLLALSEIEINQYLQFGIDKERIALLYNGIDLQEYGELPQRGQFRYSEGIGESEKIILYLGRLHRIKGIDNLIYAFDNIKSCIDNAFLIIAGPDGGELQNLINLTNQLQLQNRVKFIGPVYGRYKQSLYCDADVLVYPSIYETFPLVPFEALMCGTPIVISKNSGIASLISDAQAGYVFEYGDISTLTRIIIDLLMSPEKSKQMVICGRNLIFQKVSLSKNISVLENIYLELLQFNN